MTVRCAARIYADFDEHLHVPPEEAAVMWMAGCFMAAVCTPMYGRAIDVWGGRVTVPLALVVMGCGNVILTFARTRETTVCFAVGVFMLRSAAMGALSPYTNTILAQWFSRRRGLAMSVVEMVSMTGEFLLLAARLSIAISAMVDAHHLV